MNERIQKLAQQTDIWCDQNYHGDLHYDLHWEEKFAELIVGECGIVADHWANDEDNGRNLVSAKLKQHFGVEQ